MIDAAAHFKQCANHIQALLLGDREPSSTERFLSEQYLTGKRDGFKACAEWLELQR